MFNQMLPPGMFHYFFLSLLHWMNGWERERDNARNDSVFLREMDDTSLLSLAFDFHRLAAGIVMKQELSSM